MTMLCCAVLCWDEDQDKDAKCEAAQIDSPLLGRDNYTSFMPTKGCDRGLPNYSQRLET